MEQNRLKSWAVWASLAGLFYIVLTKIFDCQLIHKRGKKFYCTGVNIGWVWDFK